MKEKRKFVSVEPISVIAKNRFVEDMQSLHSCVIQQEQEDMIYLSSINKCYFFWLPREGNEHWRVVKS
jgi:hypothetical protein